MSVEAVLLFILLCPLLGAVFHALAGPHVPRRVVEAVACSSVGVSFILSLVAILGEGAATETVRFFTWFSAGGFSASMDVLYNPLSAVMAVMVAFVSTVILVYSVGYMRDDEDYVRYFCFMNLFVFSMLVITLSDNLVFLFLGWEGVGFCSYALIGFWYRDLSNAVAGRKAFLLTRIGDVAFGVALGLFYSRFENLSVSYIVSHVSVLSVETATLLGILLLWSAVGKSAQLPLVVWLPDAMAGPTPVSALIHAATMVTAGVYLLMRLFPVIAVSQVALTAIAVVGIVTTIYAACSALAQRDIKRVLAYSTISQLGYMFLAVGVSDIIGAMSILLSHAFFKSLLFLAAGCIIRSLHEERDIFRMGKLRKALPHIFLLFLAGSLSLGAVPPLGSFVGKDRLLLAAFSRPETIYKVLWTAAMAASFLTTLYTFRLFFVVFFGKAPEGADRKLHPVPRLMVRVLWPLAVLALFGGYVNLPTLWGGTERLAGFLATVPGAVPHLGASPGVEWGLAAADGVLCFVAICTAYFFYGTEASRLRDSAPVRFIRELFSSGFFLDGLYRKVFVRPYAVLAGILWLKIDEGTVDRAFMSYGSFFSSLSLELGLWANGRLSYYVRMLLLGFAVILLGLAAAFYAG